MAAPNAMAVAWGQILDHDIVHTPTMQDASASSCSGMEAGNPSETDPRLQCPLNLVHGCFPIAINPSAESSPNFADGRTCLPFLRSAPACGTGSIAGMPRQQINTASSFVDASMVYGNTEAHAASLRTGTGGRLRVDDSSSDHRLLPRQPSAGVPTPPASGGCPFLASRRRRQLSATEAATSGTICEDERLPVGHPPTPATMTCKGSGSAREPCFEAGDARASEGLTLSVLHTVLLREHNRIADELGGTNPSWTDDQIYQEARKIVQAIVQHITFGTFVDVTLGGCGVGHEFSKVRGPYSYDSALDPSILNEFAAAAFRFGHTQVGAHVNRTLSDGTALSPITLRDALFNIHWLTNATAAGLSAGSDDDPLAPVVRGLLTSAASKHDSLLDAELSDHLFETDGRALDLLSANIQRGRDHGLPPFNAFRALEGLPSVEVYWCSTCHPFSLTCTARDPEISKRGKGCLTNNQRIGDALESVYGSDPSTLDAWVGLLAERIIGDGTGCWEWGLSLNHLLAVQFERLRQGDRYFWDQPCMFTNAQRDAIRKVNLAGLLCANVNITSAKDNAFSARSSDRACTDLARDGRWLQTATLRTAWSGSGSQAAGGLSACGTGRSAQSAPSALPKLADRLLRIPTLPPDVMRIPVLPEICPLCEAAEGRCSLVANRTLDSAGGLAFTIALWNVEDAQMDEASRAVQTFVHGSLGDAGVTVRVEMKRLPAVLWTLTASSPPGADGNVSALPGTSRAASLLARSASRILTASGGPMPTSVDVAVDAGMDSTRSVQVLLSYATKASAMQAARLLEGTFDLGADGDVLASVFPGQTVARAAMPAVTASVRVVFAEGNALFARAAHFMRTLRDVLLHYATQGSLSGLESAKALEAQHGPAIVSSEGLEYAPYLYKASGGTLDRVVDNAVDEMEDLKGKVKKTGHDVVKGGTPGSAAVVLVGGVLVLLTV